MLTIMSSLAQDESRNISENVTWGKRRAFEQGKVFMAYKLFLGYEKGPDGQPQIVEKEAVIVRLIYAMFLEGKTYRQIASYLTSQGIPTPRGKAVWQNTTVRSILQNEKYTGNAILQKTFTVDFLSKTVKVNEGEVPQYYVKDSHPAIISQETFDLVQAEITRRTKLGKQLTSSDNPFTCKVICGECGGFYGLRTWNYSKTGCKMAWQCNKKYRKAIGEQVVNGSSRSVHRESLFCATPHMSEEQLQRAFTSAFNQLLGDKARYIQAFEATCAELIDTRALDVEISELEQECAVVAGLLQQAIAENARCAQDQAEYQRRYSGLIARYEGAKTQLDALQSEKRERAVKKARIRQLLAKLRQQEDLLSEFDENIWNVLAESITVYGGVNAKASWEKCATGTFLTHMMVRFRDGTEIRVA